MSDSIAGTVTAMICVVVGLLIIGCALVPVVEQASKTTEIISGQNTVDDNQGYYYYADKGKVTLIGEIGSTTINGVSIGDADVYIGNFDSLSANNSTVHIGPSEIEINELETTYTNYTKVVVSMSGRSAHIEATDGTETWTTDLNDAAILMFDVDIDVIKLDRSNIYAPADTPSFGKAQTVYIWNQGWMPITSADVGTKNIPSEEDEGAFLEITVTDDGGGVFSASGKINTPTVELDLIFYAPLEWTAEKSTESEYSALYAIIPIMCILGMAYVLIRRL